MVRLFARHPVRDFPLWLRGYSAGQPIREMSGDKPVEDPNDVTVWHDFESLKAAQAV